MQTTSPNASKINHQSKGDTNTDLSSSSSSFQSIISNNSINKKQLNQLLSLNWSNSQVQLEMSQIIDFWCKQSIDGFYLHNIHHIYLDKQHSPITLLDIIRDLRQFIDEHCSSKIIIAAERASLDLVNQQLLSNRKIKQYKTSLVKVVNKLFFSTLIMIIIKSNTFLRFFFSLSFYSQKKLHFIAENIFTLIFN